jgi:energy-converting hydrogenase B subunit N
MKEYDPFEFDIITQDDGDVKSNLLVRVFEILEAIKIIRQAIAQLPEGKITNRSWEMNDAPITKSYIEAPRGNSLSFICNRRWKG